MPAPLAAGVIISALGAMFSRVVAAKGGKWILAALLALGIELSITGAAMLPFLDNAKDALGGIPGGILEWMGVLQVDVYLSLVLSAHAIGMLKDARRMTILAAGRR